MRFMNKELIMRYGYINGGCCSILAFIGDLSMIMVLLMYRDHVRSMLNKYN